MPPEAGRIATWRDVFALSARRSPVVQGQPVMRRSARCFLAQCLILCLERPDKLGNPARWNYCL
ncbi:MAG: hypothetical protein CME93_03725 [Hyphomonadaceae bacterium]|nr:hypothetical protein [Hyphomonadaceae bacterium]